MAEDAPAGCSTTIVVSDLHLGLAPPPAADQGGWYSTERAFTMFLEWLGVQALVDAKPWRLVVLGDFLDFWHATATSRDQKPHGADLGSAESTLERIAATNSGALRALGTYAAAGNPVVVVPGNHDSELIDPRLQHRFGELVRAFAGSDGGRLDLSFHPWFFLLPGVLYAEHGSQYHSVNAVRNPLAPSGRWSSQLPLAALVDLYSSNGRGWSARTAVRLAAALAGRLGRSLSVSRPRRTDGAATALARRARETGLPRETLVALGRLSRGSAIEIMLSAVTALRGGHSRVPALQEKAAAAIHDLLRSEQKDAPVYVFSHTHRPARNDTAAGDGTIQCFNSGSWSTVPRRSRGGKPVDRYTFVEIRQDGDEVEATLRRWDVEQFAAITIGAPVAEPAR